MEVTGPVGKLFGNLESVHNQIHGLVPIELVILIANNKTLSHLNPI